MHCIYKLFFNNLSPSSAFFTLDTYWGSQTGSVSIVISDSFGKETLVRGACVANKVLNCFGKLSITLVSIDLDCNPGKAYSPAFERILDIVVIRIPFCLKFSSIESSKNIPSLN